MTSVLSKITKYSLGLVAVVCFFVFAGNVDAATLGNTNFHFWKHEGGVQSKFPNSFVKVYSVPGAANKWVGPVAAGGPCKTCQWAVVTDWTQVNASDNAGLSTDVWNYSDGNGDWSWGIKPDGSDDANVGFACGDTVCGGSDGGNCNFFRTELELSSFSQSSVSAGGYWWVDLGGQLGHPNGIEDPGERLDTTSIPGRALHDFAITNDSTADFNYHYVAPAPPPPAQGPPSSYQVSPANDLFGETPFPAGTTQVDLEAYAEDPNGDQVELHYEYEDITDGGVNTLHSSYINSGSENAISLPATGLIDDHQYRWRLWAHDDKGNDGGWTGYWYFSIGAPVPVLSCGSITAEPSSGLIPLFVDFSITPSGGVRPYSVNWDFGDSSNGTGLSTTHIYTTPNESGYNVAATVSDGAGGTCPANITVTANPWSDDDQGEVAP